MKNRSIRPHRGIRNSRADRVFYGVNGVLMALTFLLYAWPLWFVLIASFSDPNLVQAGQVLLLPKGFHLGGYKLILEYQDILRGYLNSILYTVVGTGSQGCQSFALWLDILPEEGRQRAADLLHSDLVEKQFRFTTGNLCTRYMLEMLVKYGYVEDAWTLLTREEYPSIGFMIQNEATTVWERFELKKNPEMNSHSHPMFGSIDKWLQASICGVYPTGAGWTEFAVRPHFPEKLMSAQTAFETPLGEIAVRWFKRYGETHLHVTVPFGARAKVAFGGETHEIGSGFHNFAIKL